MSTTIVAADLERVSDCTRPDDVPHDCATCTCDIWRNNRLSFVPKVRPAGPITLKDWAWFAASEKADAEGWSFAQADYARVGIRY